MKDWAGKRYWLVGASDGLGKALAEKLSRVGVEVILSARSEDKLKDIAASLPGRSQVVPMDIGDKDSIAAAVEAVGDYDGMVFLAGVYWPQSAKEWKGEEVEAMFDINLIGAARVLAHVVPYFVEKDAGHIVITGSLSAYRGLPGAIGYSASKAGLMSLAESMDLDLRGTGVEVQVSNPGFIRTRLTDKNDFKMPSIMEPSEAANYMFDHMNSGSFSRAFPFWFGLVFRISQLLPHALYRRAFGE